MTTELPVPDPYVGPCGGVSQLPLANSTLEALHVEEEPQSVDDHRGSFPQRLRTTGAQPLPTDTPARGGGQGRRVRLLTPHAGVM